MTIITVFSMIASLSLGVITAYTDIHFHKARNKHLLIFLLLGIAIQAACIIIEPSLWKKDLINIFLTYGTAISFYALKIWAAGDAKLFAVMVTLIPLSVYTVKESIVFPAFFVLGIVFCFALIYVLGESIVFFFLDCRSHTLPDPKTLLPQLSKDALLSWLFAFSVLDTVDIVLWLFWSNLLSENSYLLNLLNILFVVALFSLETSPKWQIVGLLSVTLFRAVIALTCHIAFYRLSVSSIVVILCVALFRNFTSRYNYRSIPTKNVQQGMVLSQGTVFLFVSSPVKGLPQYTDESTRYRITSEEAESIKRWEKSKQGRESIVIVRHIPFAPFILMGILLLWIYFLF